jgi:hypothetical protein
MSSGHVGSGNRIGQSGQRLDRADSGASLKKSSKTNREDGERLVSGAGFVGTASATGHVPVVLRKKKRNDFLPLDPEDDEKTEEGWSRAALEQSRGLMLDVLPVFTALAQEPVSAEVSLGRVCVGAVVHSDEEGVQQLQELSRKPPMDKSLQSRVCAQASKLGLSQEAGAGEVALMAAARVSGLLGNVSATRQQVLAAVQGIVRAASEVLGEEAQQAHKIGVQNHRLQTFVRK